MCDSTILVVDDEEHIRNSMKRVLRKMYRVISSENAYDAINQIEKHDIDIVITDLKMPGMDGIELLKNIRKRDSKIGIIMLTGYGNVDSYLEAISLGAFEYIHKPVENETLLCVVKKMLDKR